MSELALSYEMLAENLSAYDLADKQNLEFEQANGAELILPPTANS